MKTFLVCHHFIAAQKIEEQVDLYLTIAENKETSTLYAKINTTGPIDADPPEWVQTSIEEVSETFTVLKKRGWVYKDSCPLNLIMQ